MCNYCTWTCTVSSVKTFAILYLNGQNLLVQIIRSNGRVELFKLVESWRAIKMIRTGKRVQRRGPYVSFSKDFGFKPAVKLHPLRSLKHLRPSWKNFVVTSSIIIKEYVCLLLSSLCSEFSCLVVIMYMWKKCWLPSYRRPKLHYLSL